MAAVISMRDSQPRSLPPPFVAHRLLPGGHAQTLAGVFFGGGREPTGTVRHEVPLADGDRIVLHDNCPPRWRAGDRVALLIHGLCGCHASPYMRRLAARLVERGVRAFRMDLRGCGAGMALARHPYHSGRSEDAAAAIDAIAAVCPASPLALVGFSLGGNIALKLAGECGSFPPGNLDRVAAVCPPVDLARCVAMLSRGINRFYDRHFTKLLLQQVAARQSAVPGAAFPDDWQQRPRPRGVGEFDDAFTAPVCGFGTAANYYRDCSSNRFVPEIRVPTFILAAADDPLIPPEPFAALRLSPATRLVVSPRGGHLGFIGRRNGDGDRRWMDWRVVDWVAQSHDRRRPS